MEVSVNNNYVTVARDDGILTFSTKHIRKSAQMTEVFSYRKNNGCMVIFGAVVSLIVAGISGLVSLADVSYSGLVSFVSFLCALALFVIFNEHDAYRKREVTLHFGMFVSGDNEQYNLVSQNKSVVSDFMNALSKAMEQKVSDTYNVTIDESISADNLNIEKLVANDESKVFLYEGDVPSKERVNSKDRFR